MNENFEEFKKKIKRHNHAENKAVHFFAARTAPFFSYCFAKMKLSPNQVTLIFFLTGLLGAISFLKHETFFMLAAYVLFRFHIVFDVCDGEIARYTKKYSDNGAFYDYVIHSILYPLYSAFAYVGAFLVYGDPILLLIGIYLIFAASLGQAIKNTYYRALFKSGRSEASSEPKNTNAKILYLKSFVKNIFNFEGFMFLFCLGIFIPGTAWLSFCGVFSATTILMVSTIKFFKFRRSLL